MTNHVHLLVTPPAPGKVARVMQCLGRRYVRYVNDRYHRTGTLWEGRYVGFSPVHAHMVADPLDYPWSSHGHNAAGRTDRLV